MEKAFKGALTMNAEKVPMSTIRSAKTKASAPLATGEGVKTELLKLAERCEAATGPDRELDWRIADALNLPEPWPPTTSWPPFGLGSKFEKAIPAFSASLDAAMTLAPVPLQVGALLDAIDSCTSDEDNWLRDLPRYVCAAALRARALTQ